MVHSKRNSATVIADDRARALVPIVEAIKGAGHTTPQAIARELNRVGIRTLHKGRWRASTVTQLMQRQRSLHYSSDYTITYDGQVISRSV